MIRPVMLIVGLALTPTLASSTPAAAKAGCETQALLNDGLSAEKAQAGRVPQRIKDQCRLLRKACRTFVAAQLDPVLATRVQKHTKALVTFGDAGHEQSDATAKPGVKPDAAVATLCQESFPKAERIQEHDFTTWVPLQPDDEGGPPQLD